MTRTTCAAVCAAIAMLVAAVPAQAAQLDVAGGMITYNGEGAETNRAVFSDAAETRGASQSAIALSDEGVASITITTAARDAGCRYEDEFRPGFNPGDPISDPIKVRCPLLTGIVANGGAGDDNLDVLELGSAPLPRPVTFNGGDGNDYVEGTSGDDVLTGGPGDDQILGGSGADRIAGDAGNDQLVGRGGNDTLDGGDGDDQLEALHLYFSASDLDGSDTYMGGAGRDQLSYALLDGPVTIDLTSPGGDGRAGEQDAVSADIEVIIGSAGADTLTGDAGANEILGSDGDDQIDGGDGNDTLDGGDGDDRIAGGAGDDAIEGAKDSDQIDAGPGADRVLGDGPCTSFCRAGFDVINVRDGEADVVLCGGGQDSVVADQLDNVDRVGPDETCESVDVSNVNNNNGGGGGATAAAPRSLRLKAFLARGLPLTITCAPPCSVSAKATVDKRTQRKLRLRSRTVATGKRRLSGDSGRVAVKLSRKAKRAFKRVRKAKLTIVVTVKDVNGTSRGKFTTTIRR